MVGWFTLTAQSTLIKVMSSRSVYLTTAFLGRSTEAIINRVLSKDYAKCTLYDTFSLVMITKKRPDIVPSKRGIHIMLFLFLHKNISCGYSLEVPQ